MYRRQKPRARNPYDAIFSGSSEESLKNIEHSRQLKETSYTTRVRIRKAGEKKFGNGHLSVQGDEVSLRLLKFFGREEKIRFSRAQIDGVEFRNKGVRFQSVPTEIPSGEVDLTLEIMLKNDRRFSLHIGDEVNNRKMAKFNEICEILNGRNTLSGKPATRNISSLIHRI
jgi:hypothetical protein